MKTQIKIFFQKLADTILVVDLLNSKLTEQQRIFEKPYYQQTPNTLSLERTHFTITTLEYHTKEFLSTGTQQKREAK